MLFRFFRVIYSGHSVFIFVLCSVYLVEYTLNSNSLIEICTRTFTLWSLFKYLFAFLCKNLDHKPQSINQYVSLMMAIDNTSLVSD